MCVCVSVCVCACACPIQGVYIMVAGAVVAARQARERASAAQRKNKVRRILRSQSEYLHPGHRMYSVVSSQRTLGEATNRSAPGLFQLLRTSLGLPCACVHGVLILSNAVCGL